MKKKMVTRVMSYVLTATMIVGGLSLSPLATVEAQAAVTAKNVNLNVSNSIAGIGDPSSTATDKWTGSKVYLGNKLWRVLDSDATVADDSSTNHDAMFLFSEDLLATNKQYHNTNESITWAGCKLRKDLNGDNNNGGLFTNIFNTIEQNAIITSHITNLDNPDYSTEGGEDTYDKLFLLSLGEVMNRNYGFSGNNASSGTRGNADGSTMSFWWWLRSPGYYVDCAAYVRTFGNVLSGGLNVFSEYGSARSALNLNLSSVLFSSASEASKSATLAATTDAPANNTWKLTLNDTMSTVFAATLPGTGTAGSTITVTVDTQGNGTVTYNQTSAMLVDGDNTVVAYGKIGDAVTGDKTFTIPASISAGTYTLKVFPEQVNGGNLTDYAGNVVESTITIAAPSPTVTSVTVSPATVDVQKGDTYDHFSATVTGTNSPAQTVTWDVEEERFAGTSITSAGVLTIGSGETATSLTVRATSTADTTKSGTATVTVTDVPIVYHTITVTASPTKGGTVSGGGQVSDGGSSTLTATANSGYSFKEWTKDGSQVGTSSSLSLTNVTGDASYTAVFERTATDTNENNNSTDSNDSSDSNNHNEEIYVNPLTWNYPANQSASKVLIEHQGAACVAAFKAATPAGFKEAFSFNLLLNDKATYDKKEGTLTFTIPAQNQMKGRNFLVIGVDKYGKIHVFTDLDNNADTVTINIDGFEGYAFSLIYTDSTENLLSGIKIGNLNNIRTDSKGRYYVVQEGDVLSRIAIKLGQKRQTLIDKNNLEDANKLKVGQKIYY